MLDASMPQSLSPSLRSVDRREMAGDEDEYRELPSLWYGPDGLLVDDNDDDDDEQQRATKRYRLDPQRPLAYWYQSLQSPPLALPLIPPVWSETLLAVIRAVAQWPEELETTTVDFLARWIRLGCVDARDEACIMKRFPPARVLAAYVFYIGAPPIVLLDGLGQPRVLRGRVPALALLLAQQTVQRLVFGRSPEDPSPDILGEEEQERVDNARHRQAMRKRRRQEQAPDLFLEGNSSSSTELETSTPRPKKRKRGETAGVESTMAQIQRMSDWMQRIIGMPPTPAGGARRVAPAIKSKASRKRQRHGRTTVQFRAAYFLQWFHDDALRCWPPQSLVLRAHDCLGGCSMPSPVHGAGPW